jgi:hypothetical protein
VEVSHEMARRWVDRLRLLPISASQLGCHYAALKFLYCRTLGQPEKVAWITSREVPGRINAATGDIELDDLTHPEVDEGRNSSKNWPDAIGRRAGCLAMLSHPRSS